MKRRNIVLAAAASVVGYIYLDRLSRRSGVTADDIARSLPGDKLIERPLLVADRAAIIDATPEQLWPWLVQLGKARAGWYMPEAVEQMLRPAWRGSRRIQPEYQSLAVGDIIPDYGPGDGKFKVMTLEAPHTLVYYSVRKPSAGWTWPEADDPLPEGALALSWALLVNEVAPGRSRLYIRLRAVTASRKASRLLLFGGGSIDYLTTELLFWGLRERVAARIEF
jgi:hypothetical protein